MDTRSTTRQGAVTALARRPDGEGFAGPPSLQRPDAVVAWKRANGAVDGPIVTEQLAILFVDIRGFTRLAADKTPDRVVELLKTFFGLMACTVKSCRGEIEQLVGDCVMATFGRSGGTADEARRSLQCACRMIWAIEAWNGERRRNSEAPIRVGVGVHCGQAGIGDIVDGRFRQTMVVGSAVNIASRLERLTRDLDVAAVASGAVVSGAGNQLAARLGFVARGPHLLRGCIEPTDVWVLPQSPSRALDEARE